MERVTVLRDLYFFLSLCAWVGLVWVVFFTDNDIL
ncbi:MAG: hypothetical protein UW09_C0003G0031 [candidate division TM6 bacterium GW2011_GWF2_43_87]|nr:MAG: hypothetical protein UW09_C0003G0031 [candidate division TM6 bacterium GW2011_GWF2_43_87]